MYRRQDLLLDAFGLDLDYETELAFYQLERLAKRRNPLAGELGRLPAAGVELFQFRQRKFADLLVEPGGALQRLVVQQHWNAVSAEIDVALGKLGAGLDRQPVCRQRVLRSAVRESAMGDDQRPLAKTAELERLRRIERLDDDVVEFDGRAADAKPDAAR